MVFLSKAEAQPSIYHEIRDAPTLDLVAVLFVATILSALILPKLDHPVKARCRT